MSFSITQSGERIDVANFNMNQIKLEDIAHHLTKICRYNGALPLNIHYSVANHSIAMYYYALENEMSLEVQRLCLLHDASEAYLGDLPHAVKKLCPDYQLLELSVQGIIEEKYHITDNGLNHAIVKEIDTRIVLDEAIAFFEKYYDAFLVKDPKEQPLNIKLYPEYALSLTKAMFLHCCEQAEIFD